MERALGQNRSNKNADSTPFLGPFGAKRNKREDQVIIDATLLIEKIMKGLKEGLRYEIYPQVLFCMNVIVELEWGISNIIVELESPRHQNGSLRTV